MEKIEKKITKWYEGKIFRREFLAGGVAGITANLASYPLDTIDTRGKVHNERFKGAFRSIFHTEGIKGFYKGALSSFVSSPIIRAFRFSSYELAKKYFGSRKEHKLKIWQIFTAGAISGVFNAIASTPASYVKLKSQKDAGMPEKHTDSVKVATKTLQRKGIEGLYKGFSLAVLRDVPGCAVLFSSYEYLRRVFENNIGMNKNATILFAGGLSTIISQIFGMPQDTVLTDVQLTEKPKRPIMELRKFMKKGGMETDLKGLPLGLGRNGLIGALAFFLYEFTKGLLNVNE